MDNKFIIQAKAVSIINYLFSKNHLPAEHCAGAINDFVYCSPLTNERTPSFFVNSQKNVFKCYSSGEKGDAIRLVQLIEKCPFLDAVEKLLAIDPTQNINTIQYADKITTNKSTGDKHKIIDIKPIQHLALRQYIQSRGIGLNIARMYLKEIHYSYQDKNYFGVGFKTDKGGYALRSPNFKAWLGNSGITTIQVANSASVNLFEGFFDFLSALVYFNVETPRNTSIILNSTTNLSLDLIKQLSTVNKVYCFLDNDPTGRKAVERLTNSNRNVIDRSSLYADYNDFNERITALV